ncbi:MAG TPA: hypothetical protein VFU13_00920 [Steroidobacteraceae bacterium]|nr:hypothetical protein [Steroidobacteraceae bacterium]
MDMQDDGSRRAAREYQVALSALSNLPDHCAGDLGELAHRIGADKLALISWVRTDVSFARLIESKVTK